MALHSRLVLPDAAVRLLCQQRPAQRRPWPATASRWHSATASRLAGQQLCLGASASNIFPMQPCGFSASTVLLSSAPASSIFPMALSHGAPASNISADTAPGQQQLPDSTQPRCPGQQHLSCHGAPCQQQTSFGGEEYSGLASNLAHLGRIC